VPWLFAFGCVALAVTLTGACRSAAQPAPSAQPVAAIVDSAARQALRAQKTPGLAIAVVERGTVVYVQGFGVANVARNVAVSPDTRFEIGSITKQFTAAAILQLVEAKRLALDDRLGMWVPGYPPGKDITLRQLLQQTSGLPEYFDETKDAAQAAAQPATLATIVARIAGKPLQFAPGTRWQYSNTNYWFLGYIVGAVSHESYQQYLREHIFTPAGMTESGFISDEQRLPDMATGYTATASGVVPAPPLDGSFAGGAGEIVSTVGDLARWDQALGTGKIVSIEDATAMRTSGTTTDGKATNYGYGWVIDSTGAHARAWHNGGTLGFHTMNALYPADDEIVIVFANLAEARPEELANSIFAGTHPDVAQAPMTPVAGERPEITARVREWLHRFETGDVDRSQLTSDMNGSLTPELVAQTKAQVAPLGNPTKLVFRGSQTNGSIAAYTYVAVFANATLRIVMALDGEGKIAGYRLLPAS
jgi:D-alanyl-D-alanine carboxypeptidase